MVLNTTRGRDVLLHAKSAILYNPTGRAEDLQEGLMAPRAPDEPRERGHRELSPLVLHLQDYAEKIFEKKHSYWYFSASGI